MAKFVDMKPDRFGIELAPGGNILPVMNSWKQFAGTEGGIYYYYDFPKNAENDWLKAEYQKQLRRTAGFLCRRRLCGGLRGRGRSQASRLERQREADRRYGGPYLRNAQGAR